MLDRLLNHGPCAQLRPAELAYESRSNRVMWKEPFKYLYRACLRKYRRPRNSFKAGVLQEMKKDGECKAGY